MFRKTGAIWTVLVVFLLGSLAGCGESTGGAKKGGPAKAPANTTDSK